MQPAAFRSAKPHVELVSAFQSPFDNAVATARTCYSSKGIITREQVAQNTESRDRIARSIFEAGHHTTLQHAHFQFSMENVSRHFIWSFLHSHPFYNSEQVSQRYVEVKPGQVSVPPLDELDAALFVQTTEMQMAAYHRLNEILEPVVAREYYRIFPARKKIASSSKDVKKRTQEIARYVLPVGTFAYLYHTVSGITLLRYYRLCEQLDAPLETRLVVKQMVDALLAHDPSWRLLLEEPLPLEETPEFQHFQSRPVALRHTDATSFIREFDAELDGRVSRLVDRKPQNEAIVAQAVREVFGLPRERMTDQEAISLALDPNQNRYLGETMNVTTLSKVSRALHHAHYTFRKKLSHTADSQDQRHRMTPASRPILAAHLNQTPDYVVPELFRHSAPAMDLYVTTMEKTWKAIAALQTAGVNEEFTAYLLPNAVSVRFTESADLLNLHHKLKSRLCYNAQEEIWRASLDEARQIRECEPTIGKFLLPPCTLRQMAGTRPICPEGDRYCGVPVWKLGLSEYSRVL